MLAVIKGVSMTIPKKAIRVVEIITFSGLFEALMCGGAAGQSIFGSVGILVVLQFRKSLK